MRQATPAKEYLAMNRKLLVISVVLAVSFIFSDSSQAETVNTTADLQNNKTALAYIDSLQMLESMYRLGIEEDRKFGLHQDCKTALVFDMRVTESSHNVVEGKKAFKGVWNELWTFSMCGQMIDVAMTFIPDATGGGTSFTASPAKPKSITDKP